MAEYSEGAHTGEFLISEAGGSRSREEVIIAASQTISVGELLGQVLVGALSATAGSVASGSGGTPGNGAIGAITVDAGAPLGAYKQVFIEPASDAGTFIIEKPDGTIDGTGTVGVAYNGLLNFTQADGSNNFVAGDVREIVVAAADATAQDQYKSFDPAATDGTQTIAAIAFRAVTTGVGETEAIAAIVRDSEVNGNLLVYPSGATSDEIAAYNVALAGLGIIVR